MSQVSGSIDAVINNGVCVGCGNCAAFAPQAFSMVETEFGLIQAERVQESNGHSEGKICPFANSERNEDYFNRDYQADSTGYDVGVGFYRSVRAGFVNDTERRLASSSGGLVTYLLETLLERGMISGAIVVSSLEGASGRLQYSLVRSIHELRSARKSKYHMVSHDAVVREILAGNDNDRLIYVGIPCGVKAIKLLAAELPELKRKIKYTAAIFCGHQKSHAFTEYVAWQMGVAPSELRGIDYRLKEPSDDASKYYYQVTSETGSLKARVDSLKWMDWGLGLFKPKACDFCDDVTGEAADIIFGDAWHRKYARDYRGTNLVLTRSKELEMLLVEGRDAGEITLEEEGVQFVYATQGGNFRHRQEGLLSRLNYYKLSRQWAPPKDVSRLAKYKHNPKRDRVYLSRHRISALSHSAFLETKSRENLAIFWQRLSPEVSTYYRVSVSYSSRIRSWLKSCLSYFSRSG